MTIEQFWSIITKKWKIIIGCFILVGMGAFAGSKLMTPQYQSVALVQVSINSGATDINNLLASDQLVQTEATLATSDPVLREVASHYAGITVDQLSKQVTATSKLNTQLFEIDVIDSNPSRAAAIANDVANTLIKQQLQITKQETAQANFLILVQAAQPGLRPVKPNVFLNTGGGLAGGLFLGVFLAVLIAQFDQRLRTSEAIAEMMKWSLLAKIWLSKSDEVINPPGQSMNAEAYRILRTNIGFAVIDSQLRSLLLTSALPREGKSVVATNLAIFMAKAGKSTLLIDADMHRPVQYTRFGLPNNARGLSDAVMTLSMLTTVNSFSQQQFQQSLLSHHPSSANTFSLEPFMHAVEIPNLMFMPTGSLPPNPSELLVSKSMQELFRIINECGAEVIIIDAPPLLGVSDTSVLATKVDATLLVIDITQSDKKSLQQAIEIVQKTGTNILGYVINKHKIGRNDNRYYQAREQYGNTPIQSAPVQQSISPSETR